MSSRPFVCLAGVLIVVAGALIAARDAKAAPCPPGENLADTDANGLFDYACVGDWDNDGSCEMTEDLQAAIDQLDDPGQKTVQLDGCSFAPPVETQNWYAIVELPSNTELFGQGPATRLSGFAETDVTSTRAVISNDDHVVGNTHIVIRDLAIDGGWRGGDATGLAHARMGVYFSRCSSCSARNLVVTDTLHACLYANNASDVEFSNSTLERCGNYTGQGSRYPCVYLFASDGQELRDTRVAGIDCDGSGASAFATRRASETATLANLVFEDNVGRNTRVGTTGRPGLCLKARGIGSAEYLNTTCINTSGFASVYSESFHSDGGDHNASANVLIDGLEIRDSPSSGAPVTIHKHAENFTLRNITVHATPSHCLELHLPARNLRLEQNTFLDCGYSGIATAGEAEFAHNLNIHSNTIDGAGTDGMSLIFHEDVLSSNVWISGNLVRDFGRNLGGAEHDGIELSGNVINGIVRRNTLEEVNQQATHGICQSLTADNPAHLCTNTCLGTLAPEACLYVAGEPSYGSDLDLDGAVDACDADDDGDQVFDIDDNCVALFNPSQQDTDADRVGDACDNCILDPNPSQPDFDADLEGDRCDTDDGLIYVFHGSPEVIEWQEEEGFSEWNLYKGDLDILIGQGLYLQLPGSNPIAERLCGTTDPWFRDAAGLPVAKTALYLVTGNSAGVESGLGSDSSGAERPMTEPCPPP